MEGYSQWLYLRTKAPFQVKINFKMGFEDSSKCLMVCFGILLLHYVLAQKTNRGGDFLLCAWPGHLGIAGAALATSFATWWAVIVIVACCQWDVIDGQYMSRFYWMLIHLLHGYQAAPQ